MASPHTRGCSAILKAVLVTIAVDPASAGILLAGSACGVLAVLIDIRNSLAGQAVRSSDAESR